MHIAMISNKIPRFESGGIERFLYEMTKAFNALGHKADNVSCDSSTLVKLSGPTQPYEAAIFAGSAIMYLSYGETVHKLVRQLRCPTILALLFPFEEVEFYLGPHEAYRCAREVAGVAARADSVVTPSEYARRDYQNWCPDNASPIVIPLGGGGIRGRGDEGTRFAARLVSVARGGPLAIHKNIDSVIAVMAEVRARYSDAELILAGSGMLPGQYVADGVQWLGAITDETRIQLVRSARAMVLPSAIESFGLSVAEALGLGTPVIALNAAALPELVEHGRNGFLVDRVQQPRTVEGKQVWHLKPERRSLVRSLHLILSSELPWDDMSAAAELSVRHLTWERTVLSYLRLLQKLS